ncbi:MAG: sugar phosphate isomerase/epimerase [Fidelibacterota bacterium]|nr:MAG: sugar phosphate isomerase/epimerase [Candidatus Neomarinimicrobiota bacterium]
MSVEPLTNLSKLCLHTITTRPWSIEEAAAKYSKAGIGGITVWREALEKRDPATIGQMLSDQGLTIVSLCRGGFFSHREPEKRQSAIDENRKIIDEAAALGAPLIVLVCGADPNQMLEESRRQIVDGIGSILPHAEACGIRLAIEPLHPMYADDRSAINTLKQANDACEQLQSEWIGVVVDVYHVWWDPDLRREIKRSGHNNRLFAFHVCDWKTPTTDLLLDRGLMGEGCIPIRTIRGWMEESGFTGYNEVEIFSTIYWEQNQDRFLEKIKKAYLENT